MSDPSPALALRRLFDAAVAAAQPENMLPRHLPVPPPNGRIILLAAGKAAGSMTETAERHYLDALGLAPHRLSGIAVARLGYGRPTRVVPMIEAGHPVPDAAGFEATQMALAMAKSAREQDLVLVLLSGGASANWIAPVPGLSFADKQAVTRALLRSGANIGEMNTLRKHLSQIKGGKLAAAAYPAHVVTLAISDVAGDVPEVIGSGPTVPDPSTLEDAREIARRFKLDLPPSIAAALDDPANETHKPGDAVFARSSFEIIARPADAFASAMKVAEGLGYEVIHLGDRLEGEAREVAAEHAKLAKALSAAGRRAIMLSGGELTVTISGQGRGGPNQEYALALALALNGHSGIAALAADTDGTDGGAGSADDPAGAIIDATTLDRARAAGIDASACLSNNDSTGFFAGIGDLLQTGPTCTNVNDFRAIVIDPA